MAKQIKRTWAEIQEDERWWRYFGPRTMEERRNNVSELKADKHDEDILTPEDFGMPTGLDLCDIFKD